MGFGLVNELCLEITGVLSMWEHIIVALTPLPYCIVTVNVVQDVGPPLAWNLDDFKE